MDLLVPAVVEWEIVHGALAFFAVRPFGEVNVGSDPEQNRTRPSHDRTTWHLRFHEAHCLPTKGDENLAFEASKFVLNSNLLSIANTISPSNFPFSYCEQGRDLRSKPADV